MQARIVGSGSSCRAVFTDGMPGSVRCTGCWQVPTLLKKCCRWELLNSCAPVSDCSSGSELSPDSAAATMPKGTGTDEVGALIWVLIVEGAGKISNCS